MVTEEAQELRYPTLTVNSPGACIACGQSSKSNHTSGAIHLRRLIASYQDLHTPAMRCQLHGSASSNVGALGLQQTTQDSKHLQKLTVKLRNPCGAAWSLHTGSPLMHSCPCALRAPHLSSLPNLSAQQDPSQECIMKDIVTLQKCHLNCCRSTATMELLK